MSATCPLSVRWPLILGCACHSRWNKPEPDRPRGRGQPKKPRPARRDDASNITAVQPEETWQTVTWREGSQGSLQKQFVTIRLYAGTGCVRQSETHGRSWTGPEGWLLGERPLAGEEGELTWFFSRLPASTPLLRLVELAHLRRPVEQCSENDKGECGLADSQGRTWEGLHLHLALVMLSSTFLMLQSLEHEPQTDPAPGGVFPSSAPNQPSGLLPARAHPPFPGSGVMAY